jgi:hypothetical protein
MLETTSLLDCPFYDDQVRELQIISLVAKMRQENAIKEKQSYIR